MLQPDELLGHTHGLGDLSLTSDAFTAQLCGAYANGENMMQAADLPEKPGAGKQWFVLHVKSRQEKIVAECLKVMGIEYYLPQLSVARYYGQRKLVVKLPLFPGYVFLYGRLSDAYAADRTNRVANIVPVGDQDRLQWELANIERAITSGLLLEPCSPPPDGIRAEIGSGPNQGIQGYNPPGRDGLVLEVNVLKRAFNLSVERTRLRPL